MTIVQAELAPHALTFCAHPWLSSEAPIQDHTSNETLHGLAMCARSFSHLAEGRRPRLSRDRQFRATMDRMSATADLLASLDVISHETTLMLSAIDQAHAARPDDRREVKRRALELRRQAQELFDFLSEVPLELQTN
jgi:hypothetical protein